MINALQHVGQGVWDTDLTYNFYKNYLGFRFKINDLTIEDEQMAQVVGSVETIRALMAINVKGGGVLELVEHKSSPKRPGLKEGGYGNYGILEVGYGVKRIEEVVSELKGRGVQMLTPVYEIALLTGGYWRYSYLKDPDGLMLQLVEDIRPDKPRSGKSEVEGVVHVGVGVSDLDRSKEFYKSVLGFDRLLYEFKGHIPEMQQLVQNPLPMKVAILERSRPDRRTAGLLPAGAIKLFEVPDYSGRHIYSDRRWGDIGCMEFGLDVCDLESVLTEIKAKGATVYLAPVEIDMGSGSKGMIAYIRDPDGTIIELVEVKTVAWLSLPTFMRFAIPILRVYDRLAGKMS